MTYYSVTAKVEMAVLADSPEAALKEAISRVGKQASDATYTVEARGKELRPAVASSCIVCSECAKAKAAHRKMHYCPRQQRLIDTCGRRSANAYHGNGICLL